LVHIGPLKKDEKTSLDEIFSRCAIPVLLTYDSKAISNYAGDKGVYKNEVRVEFENGWSNLRERLGRQYQERFQSELNIQVHVVLMPLESKKALQKALHSRMKELQG